MKTLTIITALAAFAVATCGGKAEARDRCGYGGYRSYGGHCHYGGGYYRGGCSSWGVSFGLPLFYRPAYYSYYPSYSYSYPATYYRSYSYYPRTYSYAPSAYRYSTSAEVQVALARRGYYRGSIDGIIGPMSRSAIRRYQIDRGLPVSGTVDYPLMRSLAVR
jgi:hypothetical protein